MYLSNPLRAPIRSVVVIAFLILQALLVVAQPYRADWESLDQRPIPEWYRDAKFGIFIHWGVYSVPGWSSKGDYAEWYQQGLQTNDTLRQKYHAAKFGNRTYYDLANDFKAELFKPDEWAKLFEQSGAKYIVLTSKHHDGYALWPSQEANNTWGFKWNAVDVGPKRDILGDLFKAVRKTSVHAGMYYSLYEWFNPLWKKDRAAFVAQHTWPQMKDLVNTYQPDVFWTDGDWDAPAETWRSQEFLAWLYNESPVKDKVVVNDRWGTGIRFKHGGIFTPEYQPDLDFEDHYWEESRGMGFSYGYNREEDAWDYNSTQSLILQLVDKVSRGGNFLLDIGPDEHGKIPPIMQERLLQIGDWLSTNGEAIYGTTRWKMASQWSEGRKDYQPKKDDWKTNGDLMLKLTVDPDPGFAVKEVFYTYKPSSNSLYAIMPKYPDGNSMQLNDVVLPAGTSITLLATGQSLGWTTNGANTIITFPAYQPNKIKAPYAYVIKIANYGRYLSKPSIHLSYDKDALKPTVKINPVPGANIYYTLDGSIPGVHAQLYRQPFTLNKSAIIKAIAIADEQPNDNGKLIPGDITTIEAITYDWMPSLKINAPQPGLNYEYFEPSGTIDLSVINSDKPKETGVAANISIEYKRRPDRFAFSFDGYVKIPTDGLWNFFTNSDDGSRLFIDDRLIVDNDGNHGGVEKNGKALLRKGYHRLKVVYFDSGGGNELSVSLQAPGGKKERITPALLFH